MSHAEIKFFESLGLLSIAGTLVIISFEVKDLWHRSRKFPRAKRSLRSLRISSQRWSAICILWAVVGICQLLRASESERLYHGLQSLYFLALALIFLQMPRISRYIRRKRLPPDPESMLHLSK